METGSNTAIQPSHGVDLFWPGASTGSDLTVQLNIRVHFNPLVFDGWLDTLGQGTQIYKGGKGGFLANIGLCWPRTLIWVNLVINGL